MEILNNIWMILTTSNKFYRDLCISPFIFVETYIITTLTLTLLNITPSKKNKTLYVIISSLIMIIGSFLIPNPLNVFINNLLSFLLLILIFKATPFKALISFVSSVAIFGIISTLILNPFISTLNINAEILYSTPIYNIAFLFCVYVINFLLIFILKTRKIKFNILEDIDNKHKKIILTNFIFGIFTLTVQACIVFYYIDTLPIIITFLSCVSLLAYFGISIYSLTSVMKLTLTTRKLESAEEYNKTLRILHDNVRGFKHDFDNIVTTIGGYVRTNDMKGLESYYVQLEDDCQRVNNLYLLNPEIINNPRYIQLAY